jgi:hypothetical protein
MFPDCAELHGFAACALDQLDELGEGRRGARLGEQSLFRRDRIGRALLSARAFTCSASRHRRFSCLIKESYEIKKIIRGRKSKMTGRVGFAAKWRGDGNVRFYWLNGASIVRSPRDHAGRFRVRCLISV